MQCLNKGHFCQGTPGCVHMDMWSISPQESCFSSEAVSVFHVSDEVYDYV